MIQGDGISTYFGGLPCESIAVFVLGNYAWVLRVNVSACFFLETIEKKLHDTKLWMVTSDTSKIKLRVDYILTLETAFSTLF